MKIILDKYGDPVNPIDRKWTYLKPNCKGLPSISMMTVTEQYKLRTVTKTKDMIQRISIVNRYKPGPFETLKENSEPDEPTVNHCNLSILYISNLTAQIFFFK